MLYSTELTSLPKEDRHAIEHILDDHPKLRDELLPILGRLAGKVEDLESGAEDAEIEAKELRKELELAERDANDHANERDAAERLLSTACGIISDLLQVPVDAAVRDRAIEFLKKP